eukprot:9551845-Prorocentrum_lima.AAC.1
MKIRCPGEWKHRYAFRRTAKAYMFHAHSLQVLCQMWFQPGMYNALGNKQVLGSTLLLSNGCAQARLTTT